MTLDPAFARDQAHIWACNQLYNGLVQLDDSLNVKPCIAKSWEISENGLGYTFHLRSDVYFHENSVFQGKKRKVIASDFAYSLKRLASPETASPGSWVLSKVARQHDTLAIKAINDSILFIQLERPFPPFLSILSMQYCAVLPFEAVEFYKGAFRKHPVGTAHFICSNGRRILKWYCEKMKIILKK